MPLLTARPAWSMVQSVLFCGRSPSRPGRPTPDSFPSLVQPVRGPPPSPALRDAAAVADPVAFLPFPPTHVPREQAMHLSMAKYVHDLDAPRQAVALETGWQEISKGLARVVHGYLVLVIGGVSGPVLVWLAVRGGPPLPGVEFTRADGDSLLLLGVLTLGATALLSYGLVLAGQWRCLMHAPQRHSAKELMYVCVTTVLVASLLNVAGVWVDGGRVYAALRHGWDEAAQLDLHSPGVLLQLGSAGLGLIGSLVFSQFLRNVAGCFNDRARLRSVDLNLGFVGLLLGGSFGTVFFAHRLGLKAELLPWLAGGWLLCFAWHLLLVWGVRRCVEEGQRTLPTVRAAPPPGETKASGAMTLHSLSGLRRLAQTKVDG